MPAGRILRARGLFLSVRPSATRLTLPAAQILTVLPSSLYGQHTSSHLPTRRVSKGGGGWRLPHLDAVRDALRLAPLPRRLGLLKEVRDVEEALLLQAQHVRVGGAQGFDRADPQLRRRRLWGATRRVRRGSAHLRAERGQRASVGSFLSRRSWIS